MRAALLKRLQRLEEVRGGQCRPPAFQTEYLKELPADYFGERHIVTIGRDPDGTYHGRSSPVRSPTKARVISHRPSGWSWHHLRMSRQRRECSLDRRRYYF